MTQKYVSSKIVTAWASEKDGKAGYSVKYSDGYTSWCPAAQFEEANVAMGHTDNLPGWQERIVAEYVQLKDRIAKLEKFLEAQSTNPTLESVALDLLEEQLTTMHQYAEILSIRLALHGVNKLWDLPKA